MPERPSAFPAPFLVTSAGRLCLPVVCCGCGGGMCCEEHQPWAEAPTSCPHGQRLGTAKAHNPAGPSTPPHSAGVQGWCQRAEGCQAAKAGRQILPPWGRGPRVPYATHGPGCERHLLPPLRHLDLALSPPTDLCVFPAAVHFSSAEWGMPLGHVEAEQLALPCQRHLWTSAERSSGTGCASAA